jgi:dimethylglycine dehydrogenase
VRERVAVMDLSAFAKIDIVGPEAEPFLERMIANRVPRRIGAIVLSHILNEAGTIEAEVTVARLADDRFYLMCAAFSQVKVRDWLVQHRRDGETVEVEDLSDRYGCLVLAGPRSRDVPRQ